VTLFFTLEQAAALLGCDVEQVEVSLRHGELTRCRDGIPADQVALLLMQREQEGRG